MCEIEKRNLHDRDGIIGSRVLGYSENRGMVNFGYGFGV